MPQELLRQKIPVEWRYWHCTHGGHDLVMLPQAYLKHTLVSLVSVLILISRAGRQSPAKQQSVQPSNHMVNHRKTEHILRARVTQWGGQEGLCSVENVLQ